MISLILSFLRSCSSYDGTALLPHSRAPQRCLCSRRRESGWRRRPRARMAQETALKYGEQVPTRVNGIQADKVCLQHEVNRSLSLKSVTAAAGQRKPKNLSGQLFVIRKLRELQWRYRSQLTHRSVVREAVFENLPLPQEKTSLKITLDNGKQKVEAGSRLLEKTVLIRSEFEL